MKQDQTAELEWKDGAIPVATRFDDPYFSLENGLDETRHVFLAGNDLPARFRPGFHIAELGFGTGLNMLATVMAWQGAGAPEHTRFTSFEAYPMAVEDIARALEAFPEARALADPFLTAWGQGKRVFDVHGLVVEVIEGDAREELSRWSGGADAWFLDGFSPAKNPELWGEELMADVARHTNPNGTFATYTAAGFVRRALDAAGFAVERSPGYGRKRHMSRGALRL
ncbi:tRNA U34 5-methylaminomethyl-2-thiouridine-forming methyltransferase MnmC [Aliiroseovarius crassostreae]|uniref:FAD-dependent oxidoreductase n=1 Tax=Aliiroseovarius crassostreae TaxID=154981 RepID=A0A0P7IJ68_9RHOB|nr:tRNA (5-methylaminomethyl-2-thiouridine)(34)-methyltransferase MnmD [Aliiroseovarius crassostreae]KPN63936.1 FAD-dependent oxidoreductase [Aliiroseovarius crassostreae]SFU49926.1 tRNA U34 5-methylaminomethyl-2-thiouridine-forming methyltransferase MnmC [Aliiroseovarius crassostreae]